MDTRAPASQTGLRVDCMGRRDAFLDTHVPSFTCLDVVRKPGLFLSVCLEITVHTSVLDVRMDRKHVLLVCFVISLANSQMFVSKYELQPSKQSEFSA